SALADGRWPEARELFDGVLASTEDGPARAAAATGLSDAAWWLGDVADALRARRVAYEAWRGAGGAVAAAQAAPWPAREYLGALGNDAAAQGWLRRAETLAGDPPPAGVAGWLALVRASLAPDRAAESAGVEGALALARRSRDGDLEALALARKGLGLVMG